MITLLTLWIIAFGLFGFFAGSEMAYLSCNKLRLRHLADEGNRRAQLVMRFHKKQKQFLTTILVGTNLMHVTVTAVFTYFIQKQFPAAGGWWMTVMFALFIVIFAETIPKDWFRRNADDFMYRFAPALNIFDRVFSGFSNVLLVLTDVLISATMFRLKRNPFVTREEFRYVIEESTKGGVLLEHEKKLIDSILNLSSRRVEEVMVPLNKFPKIPFTGSISDVKNMARKNLIDVAVVYEEIPSIVVGLIYIFDILFEENENLPLSGHLRSPIFVTHDTSLEKALFILQAKHANYAAVINLDRDVVGVVSLENLIQL